MPHDGAPVSERNGQPAAGAETEAAGPRGGVVGCVARGAIVAYRYSLSPLLHLCGVRCRHAPTCSAYALEAYRRHAPAVATRLTATRLLNCRPGGTWGYDPVP